MSRESFLIGLLCGLVLCAGMVWTVQRATPVHTPSKARPAVVVPQPSRKSPPSVVPPHTHRDEFNGQTYYIIPLASRT